ncbi:MAG: transcription antitermination factor NusB [Candidatus Latescibacteria bacterium]|nr:transcription antitermination factor NusB [Candidatus Latescibacterota bacterium]MEE3040459.1 transcription antitermination factor NusB [Candidatus Latescibacterota bacterium]
MTDLPTEESSTAPSSPRQQRWDDGEWGNAEQEKIPQSRSGARQLALRALYWESANPGQVGEALQQLGEACGLTPKLRTFAEQVATAAVEYRSELDDLVRDNATNWHPDRIARLDGLILRLGLAELLYIDDVPARVTIQEAVELAKTYGGGQSYRFVNGLLDAIARQRDLDV